MLSNDGFRMVMRNEGGQSEISPLEQGNIDVAGALNLVFEALDTASAQFTACQGATGCPSGAETLRLQA